jgi:hypothetical protein
MTENNYFKCSVRIPGEDAKGRIKYRKDEYLVFAISPTDVEAKITKHLQGTDFEVTSIALTKILEVLN